MSNEEKNEKIEGQLLAKNLRLVLQCSQQKSQYLNFSCTEREEGV